MELQVIIPTFSDFQLFIRDGDEPLTPEIEVECVSPPIE